MRPAFPGSVIATAALVAAANAQSPRTSEWPSYGHDAGGTRFSPLRGDRYHQRRARAPPGLGHAHGRPPSLEGGRFEATPIVVDGTMYLITPMGRIIALDPETGTERWVYDARLDARSALRRSHQSRRLTWLDPARAPDSRAADASSPRRSTRGSSRSTPRTESRARTSATMASSISASGCATRRNIGRSTRRPRRPSSCTTSSSSARRRRQPADRRRERRGARVRRAHRREEVDLGSGATATRATRLRHLARPEGASHRRGQRVVRPRRRSGARSRVRPHRQREPRLLRRRATRPEPLRQLHHRAARDDGKVVWSFQTVHHDLWDYDIPAHRRS